MTYHLTALQYVVSVQRKSQDSKMSQDKKSLKIVKILYFQWKQICFPFSPPISMGEGGCGTLITLLHWPL